MASGSSYPAVRGVTFEVLCTIMGEVSLQQMQAGQLPTAHTETRSIDPYVSGAASHGIDATSWRRAQLAWGCRAILDPSLAMEQGQLIARVMMPGMPAMPGFMPAAPPPPTVDPADPALAPIDGVTIESYVRMVATQIEYPEMTPEQATDMATQIGFPADRWQDIHLAWGSRITTGPPASVRYAQLICLILS